MAQKGYASWDNWNDGKIVIRFHQIGHYQKFLALSDDFKKYFLDRDWEPTTNRWIIPSAQRGKFEKFCKKHGLIVKRSGTQLSLF